MGVVTSAPMTLRVIRNTVPPAVLNAFNLGATNAQVVFSKSVEPASATNTANYVFTNGLNISGASLAADNVTVALATGPLVYGSNYTVVINGVRDRAFIPNTIAPNSQVRFVASLFAPGTIGQPSPGGATAVLSNGLDVTAGGAVGGTADAAPFDYLMQSGNFDFSVRVQGLSLSSLWAQAGLMARASLDPASAFAGVFATPGIANCYFDSRSVPRAADSRSGAFPVNYPNTWLRLQRAGNQFNGYAGFDGSNWVRLGTVSLAMNPVYVGLVAASQNSSVATLAQFRDFGKATSAVIGNFGLPGEPLGPSSRRTQFAFSEIMYAPAPRADGLNTEYVEIYNSNPWWDNLGGYQLAGQVQYTFPPKTIVPGGGFLVVAAAPADVQSVYGITNVVGPYVNSLGEGGQVQLLNAAQGVVLEVTYTNVLPWPAGASYSGHSIVLARPTYGEADPRAWAISDVAGGSPGGAEAYRPSPLRNVMINELLANPDDSQTAYVELYNHSSATVDVSGCVLTDDPATNRCTLPSNTVMAAGGFLAVPQTQLGFELDPTGGLVLLRNPDGSRVLDAVTYEAQGRGVASGRWPDGGTSFIRWRK